MAAAGRGRPARRRQLTVGHGDTEAHAGECAQDAPLEVGRPRKVDGRESLARAELSAQGYRFLPGNVVKPPTEPTAEDTADGVQSDDAPVSDEEEE